MITRKPKRDVPGPDKRSKARRAFRAAAQLQAGNDALPVYDSRGRPRKHRYFVKA